MRIWLWKLAVWTYFPRWILGNRFQSWWYFQNERLQEWLLLQLERDLSIAEAEQRDEEEGKGAQRNE